VTIETPATLARARFAAEIPRDYSPRRHLLVHTAVGALGVVAPLAALSRVHLVELLIPPATFVATNLIEYLGHRYLMHRRSRALPYPFEAHTLRHHRCFAAESMAIGEPRELWLIVFGTREVALALLATLPGVALLAALATRNAVALAASTIAAHYLLYEWIHLVSHLPGEHWLARRSTLAGFRRRHALHHAAPGINFNVTAPLWDWLLRTLRR